MRKLILFLLLFSAGIFNSYSQELPKVKHIKLNKKSHYKSAEPEVLKLINYLFETSIDTKNYTRKEAGEFLIRWMNGTPDYVFVLEDKEIKYFNTDADLMLVYMAGLTKFTLKHPTIKDQKELIIGTMKLVLPYLDQQVDKKSWSNQLWQLNDANLKNRLESFLYPN